jgi:signal transduction histidine kinase
MIKRLQSIFKSTDATADLIKDWKVNAFKKTLAYFIIPFTILLIIVFIAFKAWLLVAFTFLLLSASLFSMYLAKKQFLVLSVNIAIISVSTINYYLLSIHDNDGLYFMVFMIIIAGVFIGSRAAFAWAIINTSILMGIAYFSNEYVLFPDISVYFNNKLPALNINNSFMSIIFLYFVGVFLSILIERYFTELIQKVKQAHDEKIVLESELFQSQKMESIGLLASGIAHDFNHGLTSIKSCANLILKKHSRHNDELARYAQNIYDTCGIIHESTGKLLSFTRKSRSDMSVINVHEVIESMVNLLKYMLDKNVEIKTSLLAGQCTVKGNFSHLQSMFMNLAVNASDAMADGGVLTFSTMVVSPEPGQLPRNDMKNKNNCSNILSISISDTGIGMDTSIREKIFAPFFTTKDANKGTGLGLSIVKRIAEEHNGLIQVTSEPGKGSTFVIQLPLAQKPG